mmetsp:Transcript_1999/g.2238  ORF Transcript_1999/g.2238 Transcript_1999/m.2238 type:complete len:416 (-) Transcript_1999:54-1301(-)
MNMVTLLTFVTACLSSSIWALPNLEDHCDSNDALSLLQTNRAIQQSQTSHKLHQPYGVADGSLQAPAEGGEFSAYYNKRTVGNGIHKWLQYFPAYERHLAKFIGKEEVHILEIGIQSGGSMDMWKSVFGAGTHVYGCDINPKCKSYEDDQIKVFIGDQESPDFWKDVLSQVPKIDILIDDGGHSVEQQIATLGIMLPHVSPDGVYITEDVHGRDNEFWQNVKFETLSSPQGKKYTGLGSLVGSVHVYPYLLVIEREKNTAPAIVRQLGTDEEAWSQTDLEKAVANAQPTDTMNQESACKKWLQKLGQTLNVCNDETSPKLVLERLPAGGLLFLRGGDEQFSFDASWTDQSDSFMSKMIADFNSMHDGNCCNWNATTIQQKVDSLHIYPNLLIAQRTSSEDRLIKAPQHGTSWIPY